MTVKTSERMEQSERAYLLRRASDERELARKAATDEARQAHDTLAAAYEERAATASDDPLPPPEAKPIIDRLSGM